MKTPKKEIVWVAPGFTRNRVNAMPVYRDADNDEIVMDRDDIAFLIVIHLERIEYYLSTLQKAGELSSVHEVILQTIIENGKKEMLEHCKIVDEHLGRSYVERSDDELVGCALELPGDMPELQQAMNA